jgi:hypothetical protein
LPAGKNISNPRFYPQPRHGISHIILHIRQNHNADPQLGKQHHEGRITLQGAGVKYSIAIPEPPIPVAAIRHLRDTIIQIVLKINPHVMGGRKHKTRG